MVYGETNIQIYWSFVSKPLGNNSSLTISMKELAYQTRLRIDIETGLRMLKSLEEQGIISFSEKEFDKEIIKIMNTVCNGIEPQKELHKEYYKLITILKKMEDAISEIRIMENFRY